MTKTATVEKSTLYALDYYAWALEQASALRARDTQALDFENLAEEVEDLAKRDRRQLSSRLRVVLLHLIKLQVQPSRRSRSWAGTLDTRRQEIINDVLEMSPSLRRDLAQLVERAYPASRRPAATETGMSLKKLSAPLA